tara:strand:- start:375 stop:773 length:399 start_codon:yes stop_codon:yes gene_type:complete
MDTEQLENNMKYIIPFTLLLLSGCGGSLENCADDNWGSVRSGSNMHDRCNSYLTERQKSMSFEDRLFNEVQTPGKFFRKDYYECAFYERQKDKQTFLEQSLSQKLEHSGYEYQYSNCESLKQRRPETFDAKY